MDNFKSSLFNSKKEGISRPNEKKLPSPVIKIEFVSISSVAFLISFSRAFKVSESMALTFGLFIPVSYTHLTLPTICSV